MPAEKMKQKLLLKKWTHLNHCVTPMHSEMTMPLKFKIFCETTWHLNVITFYIASIKSMILATPLQIPSDLLVHATQGEPSELVVPLST